MCHTNRTDAPCRGPALSALVAAAIVLIAMSSPGFAQGVSNDVCAGCHEDIAASFDNTAHGIYFNSRPALAEYGCESCHGSGTRHIEEGTAESIINPARQGEFSGKELCLACHQGPHFDDWAFSAHNNAGLNCADCHDVHGSFEHVLKKPQPQLCYDCHSDVKAAMNMPSHHPVKEGKLDCNDCHGPHGEPARQQMYDTDRELCFTCHASKEGPFVYEHAPVNEDCMICHTPHGSVANNLLKENEPALCLNCHAMHFHATVEGVDGAFTVPMAPERAGVSTPDGWKRGFLTKCTQCHTAIHGADLPSQAISSGGNALTR
jgi:DmsE family decaheme c-type cytochrome